MTVAAVVDDRPPYSDDAVYLFASLEVFGGRMRRARRRAYVVGGASPSTRRRLADLGVDVRDVPPVDARFRFANKLAMFDAEAKAATGLLVALDTDIVVAGDFAAYLDGALVQAKPPDGDPLGIETWTELFALFGLAVPPERHPTSLLPGWTHAYFNTGVVMVPGQMLRPLHDRWRHFVRALIERRDALHGVADALRGHIPERPGATADDVAHLYYADQWAFALARHDLGLPYAVLPLALNFPTIYRDDQEPGRYVRERFGPHAVTPLLLHHHHRVAGGLPPTGYAEPDRVIERVNDALFARSGEWAV